MWGGGDSRSLVMRNGGAYVPDAENQAPVAAAQVADRVECTSAAGARVTLDGLSSSDPDDVAGQDSEIVSYEWIEGIDTGSPVLLGNGASLDVDLPLGSHAIALRVTDACGATGITKTSVTVQDTVAPALTLLATPAVLWPADRKMRTIDVQPVVSDLCDASPAVTLTGLTANEPSGGDAAGADVGTADFQVDLRATRSGNSSGRVYRLTYQAVDSSGNPVEKTVLITVPHDRRGTVPGGTILAKPAGVGITPKGH